MQLFRCQRAICVLYADDGCILGWILKKKSEYRYGIAKESWDHVLWVMCKSLSEIVKCLEPPQRLWNCTLSRIGIPKSHFRPHLELNNFLLDKPVYLKISGLIELSPLHPKMYRERFWALNWLRCNLLKTAKSLKTREKFHFSRHSKSTNFMLVCVFLNVGALTEWALALL